LSKTVNKIEQYGIIDGTKALLGASYNLDWVYFDGRIIIA
jgi:hypothetical protein